MKCTVSPSTLSAALSLVARAVSTRSTLPVLGNVLLETSDAGMRITGTNLDIAITVTIAATVLDEGRTTAPAKLLAEYVASLAEAPCTLNEDPATHILKLTCGVHRSSLHGIAAAEFPPLPQPSGEPVAEVDSVAFAEAINQTVMAASGDEASPVLTGVLLQLDGNRLTMVATDRHRLAVKSLDIDRTASGESVSAIVPSRYLAEVGRAITPHRPRVTIAFSASRNQVFFSISDVEINSRLIEGVYPNYAQVIPAEATTTVRLPTADLLREVKTAAVLARDSANPVRLRVAEGILTLTARTAEVGDDEAPLVADINGEDIQLAFNARYMLEVLNVLDSERVQLSFNGSIQPSVVRPIDRDDYLCIIMPVRVP